jgi:putative chitinase
MDLNLGDTRLIIEECKRQGLLRNQAAYVLATAYWETARTMKPVVEAFWLSEEWRRNNLRYYPWHGRGYVQLTWEANYKKAALKLGVPLDKDPTLAMKPEVASKVLVMGSKEGWFTNKKLSDYITLQHSNFVGARAIINGTDKASDIAKIAEQYDAMLKVNGYEGDRINVDVPPAKTSTATPNLIEALIAIIKKLFGGSNG